MKVLQRFRTSDLDHKILILDVQSHIKKQKSGYFFWDDNALRNGKANNFKKNVKFLNTASVY